MCIASIYFPVYAINLEINLSFFIKLFLYRAKNILKTKRAFKVKWKHFSSFLKRFQFPKIVSGLRVDL